MAGIQFILGRSGTGKTRWCIESVCAALTGGGDEPLILLVPEQATYQAEHAILKHPKIAGFSRLRILSFNRLQFWLNTPARDHRELSTTGKQMILHKLLLELAGELSLYKPDAQRAGLAAKAAALLTELQYSNCTTQQIGMLAEQLAMQSGQELAAAKWADIAKLYTEYEAFFEASGFVNPDIGLNRAGEKAAASPLLRGAQIWVDGFSGFSIQERDLLIEMLRVSKQASIALCLDPAAIDLNNEDKDTLDPCSLFASTEQTYCELLRIARGCKLSVSEPVILDKSLRFQNAPALQAIEANPLLEPKPSTAHAKDTIHIAACQNVRAETAWIARRIRGLVKDDGLRYRDIAVVVPNMDTYRHYIESAFSQFEIPYFLDRPRLMKTHPLTELIGAALQAVRGGFAMSDVLSFLKSGLIAADFHTIDMLETYCRAFDVQTSEWLQSAEWDFAPAEDKARYDEAALDAFRRQAVKPLIILHETFNTNEQTTPAQFARAVWDLLETLNVQKTLTDWAASDAADQQFGHRQVFAKLVSLLDEMCDVFSDTVLSAAAWGAIFLDALSSLTIKLIPPTLDQVLVGSIERSRHPDVKAVFLLGVTQKQFPIPVGGEALLTEQEYQLAQDAQLELANPYDQQLTHRPYLAYIALTRASRKMVLSYPLLDEKGAAIVPWSGVEQLCAMFADLEIHYPPPLSERAEDIQNTEQLTQWLTARLGKDRQNDSNEYIAAGLLDRMARSSSEALIIAAEHVHQSLAYDNAAALDANTTAKLFSFPMTTSVTRLGTFAACPYQYFARYTLGLEKRKLLRFEPMDVGTFYHSVLEAMFNALKARQSNWADLSTDALLDLCDEQIENIIEQTPQIANFIRRRVHHQYILHAAKETLRRFVPHLAVLAAASRFQQTAAELEFGPTKDIHFTLPLDKKRQIQFSGKIDRLDMADIDGQPAAVVFDFKLSSRSANFAKIFYGLDLQLPVYLLAIRRVGTAHAEQSETIPAGAFFLPIDTGLGSADLSRVGAARAEKAFNKAKGLFDGRYAGSIDTETTSQWSRYYNFYTTKEGPYGSYAVSGALKPEDFTALLDYTQRCVKNLITDQSAGKVDIHPYRIGKTSPCTYCDYRSLCRFDWQINDYNILESLNKEEALEKMKEKL